MDGETDDNSMKPGSPSLTNPDRAEEAAEDFKEKSADRLHPIQEDLSDRDQMAYQDYSETTCEVNVEERNERITQFPISRIKQIMKMDPEVTLASQDAVFVISKSTELFVRTLVKEAHHYTSQFNRKTVQKKDVESAISNTDCLLFLDGALDV